MLLSLPVGNGWFSDISEPTELEMKEGTLAVWEEKVAAIEEANRNETKGSVDCQGMPTHKTQSRLRNSDG